MGCCFSEVESHVTEANRHDHWPKSITLESSSTEKAKEDKNIVSPETKDFTNTSSATAFKEEKKTEQQNQRDEQKRGQWSGVPTAPPERDPKIELAATADWFNSRGLKKPHWLELKSGNLTMYQGKTSERRGGVLWSYPAKEINAEVVQVDHEEAVSISYRGSNNELQRLCLSQPRKWVAVLKGPVLLNLACVAHLFPAAGGRPQPHWTVLQGQTVTMFHGSEETNLRGVLWSSSVVNIQVELIRQTGCIIIHNESAKVPRFRHQKWKVADPRVWVSAITEAKHVKIDTILLAKEKDIFVEDAKSDKTPQSRQETLRFAIQLRKS